MAFAPGDHEIYNFERPFIVYHYYMLNLSDQYPGVQKKRFLKRKNALSLYKLYGHALTQESLSLDHKNGIFDRPFPVHYQYAQFV